MAATSLGCERMGWQLCGSDGHAWLRSSRCGRRRPARPSAQVFFTALPAASFGSMSQDIPRPPPRHGREAMAPRKTRSKLPGIVSKDHRCRRRACWARQLTDARLPA